LVDPNAARRAPGQQAFFSARPQTTADFFQANKDRILGVSAGAGQRFSFDLFFARMVFVFVGLGRSDHTGEACVSVFDVLHLSVYFLEVFF